MPDSTPAAPPRILLFLKAPVLGQVKTRLAATIGEEAALDGYRQLVEGQIRRLPADWRREVHFSPPDAIGIMAQWLGRGFRYLPQVNGDLGTRLESGFADAFASEAGVVCAIGGDCPELGLRHFEETRRLLDNSEADLVFGPTWDGGYYLIGMRRLWREVFQNIPWSAPNTLEVSLGRANDAGARVALLPELADVDTVEDLKRSGIKVSGRRPFQQ